MNWIRAIKEINKSNDNNRLVVFVGAGVSKNSGIPTWGELIKEIANRIGYQTKGEYEQNEYLRIPEYYSKMVSKREYTEFIAEQLSGDNGPNAIDDIVFNILPHHIITTNYDSLLERSQAVNGKLYSVVTQDNELLSTQNDRYIIKMHGDLSVPETIVLRESDYIHYEQTHPLITTFIKSLLVNHSFLFIGYSLNDYNLNLIIGWINYYRNLYKVKQKPVNILVTSDSESRFENRRLQGMNISVLYLQDIPRSIKEIVPIPSGLVHPAGRDLYAFLYCVENIDTVLESTAYGDYVTERCKPLLSYRRIAYEDLAMELGVKNSQMLDGTVLINDSDKFEKLEKLIKEKHMMLMNCLGKTGICALQDARTSRFIDLTSDIHETDMLFSMALNNQYNGIRAILPTLKNTSQKAYYMALCGEQVESILDVLNKEAQEIQANDTISILLNKIRKRLISITHFDKMIEQAKDIDRIFDHLSINEKKSVGYLKILTDRFHKNMNMMTQLLEKQKAKHDYNSNTMYFDIKNRELMELRSFAYEYYYFFKMNWIPLDRYSEPKEYLSFYIQAILCSYLPTAKGGSSFGPFETIGEEPHPIDEVDLDILVKFISPKDLLRLIKDYETDSISLDLQTDISKKIQFLIESIQQLNVRQWADYLYNLTILIYYSDLSQSQQAEAIGQILDFLADMIASDIRKFDAYSNCFSFAISRIGKEYVSPRLIRKVIDIMKNEEVYRKLNNSVQNNMQHLLKQHKTDVANDIVSQLDEFVSSQDSIEKQIYFSFIFRSILNIKAYSCLHPDHLHLWSTDKLTVLVWERIVTFNNDIFNVFLDNISKQTKQKELNPGVYTYPDHLSNCIEQCILFDLMGCNIDLKQLSIYKQYSTILQFVLDPDEFDYSKIDLKHYMWENLIYSDKYRHRFIKHKEYIVTEEMKTIFQKHLANTDLQKIVYGILLEKDELRGFPEHK